MREQFFICTRVPASSLEPLCSGLTDTVSASELVSMVDPPEPIPYQLPCVADVVGFLPGVPQPAGVPGQRRVDRHRNHLTAKRQAGDTFTTISFYPNRLQMSIV